MAENNMCMLTKNNFASAYAVLYISLWSLHHYDMKLPNFTSPLYGVGKNNTKIVSFFLNLDNDRYGLKENFAKICQLKLNQ